MLRNFRLGKHQQTGSLPVQAVNDEKHFRRFLPFDVFKEVGVKRPMFLFVSSDRQQAFRLVDDNDVLVFKNDLDAATG